MAKKKAQMKDELTRLGLHLELRLVVSRWMVSSLVDLKERCLWKDKSYLAMLGLTWW